MEEEEKIRPRGKKGREEQRGYVIFLKVTQPGNDRLNTESNSRVRILNTILYCLVPE